MCSTVRILLQKKGGDRNWNRSQVGHSSNLDTGSKPFFFTVFLRIRLNTLRHFYSAVGKLFPTFLVWSIDMMDIVFLAIAAVLWGLMALMVWGFRKLERPQGGRP